MRPRHLNLRAMALKLIADGEAAKLVPINGEIETEVYIGQVERELRRLRLALTDSAFRARFIFHLA